jgi:hypothetical protein
MNNEPSNNHNHHPLSALAAQANDALAPQDRFAATPTSRNGDGHFRTEKPTSGISQWGLQPKGEVPPTAFAMLLEYVVWFRKLAFAHPPDGDSESAIRTIGYHKFNSVWGAEEKKFEHESAAGRREVQRLAADAARLENEISDIPATVVQEPAEARLPSPRSLKFWAFLLCAIFFCISGAGAVANIVTTLLPFTQSVWLALMVSGVWVMLSVALKIAAGALQGAQRKILHWSIAIVGLVGAIIWLVGLVVTYAGDINLNDLGTGGLLVRSKALPFVGQLLAELAVGFACLSGMFAVLNHPRTIVPNENRRRISDKLARVNKELGEALGEVAKADGNLAELHASRESYVAEGLAILRLRRADAAFLAEMQRQHGDNQRLLAQFVA